MLIEAGAGGRLDQRNLREGYIILQVSLELREGCEVLPQVRGGVLNLALINKLVHVRGAGKTHILRLSCRSSTAILSLIGGIGRINVNLPSDACVLKGLKNSLGRERVFVVRAAAGRISVSLR